MTALRSEDSDGAETARLKLRGSRRRPSRSQDRASEVKRKRCRPGLNAVLLTSDFFICRSRWYRGWDGTYLTPCTGTPVRDPLGCNLRIHQILFIKIALFLLHEHPSTKSSYTN